MKNPSVIWFPKDFLADPGVQSLSVDGEYAWRRILDALAMDGLDGAVSRSMSWWAGFLRVDLARAAAMLGEIRKKRVGDVEPDPEADGVAACDADVTVSCRRLVRQAELAVEQVSRRRERARERLRRWRSRKCGKAAMFSTPRSVSRNARQRFNAFRNAPQRSVTLGSVSQQVPVVSSVEERRDDVKRSVTLGNASHARAFPFPYPFPSTDSHPPGLPVPAAAGAGPNPGGASLVRRGPGAEPGKHSPAARGGDSIFPGPGSPAARRVAPPDAERRAPTPMRELLAALVPTLAPSPVNAPADRPERPTSTLEARPRGFQILDPIGLAVRAWRSGKSPAGTGTWGLHVALRAAAHAIREGREQLRLFWHLLRQPLQAWCRSADDDQATAWMRQVRVRTC